MTECKTFYFCSEEWERLKKWRWRRMVDVNQGGSAAAAWWQHRKGSITELTDSMLQPRAGYTHAHTGHWLHTGWKRPSPWLWKKCRCFVCSSKWEPECVRWTLDGCVMLVVARAGRSSILVLCGGQRAAAVMVDTSYNNYSTRGGAGTFSHWDSISKQKPGSSVSISVFAHRYLDEWISRLMGWCRNG